MLITPLHRSEPSPRLLSDDQTASLDWDRLQSYLQAQGLTLDRDEPARQFAGGLGNLNYLVSIDGSACVLRRPPFGPIPIGANDMAREHRVLSRIWHSFPLAPRSIHYCPDPDVIGAHFLVMEYRPGLVISGSLPQEFDSKVVGPALSRMMVEVLADLHSVDTNAAGLDELGRPSGFLGRTVEGWARRALALDVTAQSPSTLVSGLIDWLRTHQAPDHAPTLLHSDFKLDNMVLDPATLHPRALLDWDMSTRGDPLLDLATLLSYWTEAGDPEPVRALNQMPTTQPGFASRAAIVKAYAARTGRDVSDFLFYRVLALFKLGVVFLQLNARYRAGATTDPRYARFGRLGMDILAHTQDVAQLALV